MQRIAKNRIAGEKHRGSFVRSWSLSQKGGSPWWFVFARKETNVKQAESRGYPTLGAEPGLIMTGRGSDGGVQVQVQVQVQ
jgi:hypothetical protein